MLETGLKKEIKGFKMKFFYILVQKPAEARHEI